MRGHLPHDQAQGARRVKFCSSTPSTKSRANAPRVFSPTTTSSTSFSAYEKFKDEPGFARVVTLEEVRAKDGNLSLPLYIASAATGNNHEVKAKVDLVGSMDQWRISSAAVDQSLAELLPKMAVPNRKDKTNPAWTKLPLFSRKNWTRVRFGNAVRQLKEETDPVADGVERYVAGEHMGTENVHIRQWGNVGDGYLGPAFIRRFRKGQVLYGSRRTYLKKVAVAEWDGVTANTTFVLEAVAGKLLPELLPWLMLSEKFTRHSVQESKGSTNPYINFPDIAKFEFDLPPLDQQHRIAEILWAVDETKQAYEKSLLAAAVMRRTRMKEFFSDRKFPTVTIRESGDVQLGRQRAPKYQTGAFTKPYLRVANVFDGFIDYNDVLEMDFDKRDFQTYCLSVGDILLNEGQSRELVGRCAIYDGKIPDCCFQNTLIRYRVGEKVLTDYAFAFFQHSFHTGVFAAISSQTTSIAHLGSDRFAKLNIPIPPKREQQKIADTYAEIRGAELATSEHLLKISGLQSSIVNAITT